MIENKSYVEMRNAFSICSLKELIDEKQYFQMYEELEIIMKLIDHFKLEQEIGL